MKRQKILLRRSIALIGIGAALIASSAAVFYLFLPDVSVLTLENPKTTAYIQRYVRRTRAKGKKPVIMMRWVPLYEISPYLQHAVLVGEDDSFYQHSGVDLDAVEKAFEYDRKKGHFLRGASTITQQVARNLYLSPERSLLRKAKEIAIALKLERELTKDRILELYLNIAEWGQGIYGAQAASEIYFGKSAADLTPDEAAALAAALPSPWRRNPSRAAEEPLLARKKEVILDRMRQAGYLPPGVSEGEIEVPGTAESARNSSKPAAKDLNGAPCDSSSSSSKPGEAPDSCGPPRPASLF